MLQRALVTSALGRWLIPASTLLAVGLVAVVITTLASASPNADGVEMSLVPNALSLGVGSTAELTVQVDPNGVPDIAAAGFFLSFDADVIQVIDVAHVNTPLSFPVGNPVIDNELGTAEFAAATFSPLPASQPDFSYATVTVQLIATPPQGDTELVFQYAPDGSKTGVTNPSGEQLLDASQRQTFVGATINVPGVSMSLEPDEMDLVVESSAQLSVHVDPNGIPNIAAAGFFISFDPSVLQVTSVSHVSAPLSFPVGNPVIDNEQGTAEFAAATFSPLPADQEPFNYAVVAIEVIEVPVSGTTQLVFEYAPDGSKTGVTNPDGEQLLDGSQRQSFVGATLAITDSAPGAIDASIVAPDTADEGTAVPFDASQSTPTLGEEFTSYVWDFGDGTPTQDAVEINHTYADNDVYTVTLVVTDSSGATAEATHQINVHNVVPAVAAGDPVQADEGVQLTYLGGFSDPGVGDTHGATINWGDGSGPEAGTVDQAANTVSGTHSYEDEGAYTVTVTVTDDDDGVGADVTTVNVSNLPPAILSVQADPNALPQEGGTSRITVVAEDVPSDPLTYSFDCDGDGFLDIGPQAANFTDCTFTQADFGPNTVNVQVLDDAGDASSGSTTVNVGVSADQWDATLSFSTTSQDVQLNSGISELIFGIHPDATDLGDPTLDSEIPPSPPQPYILFYFDYAENDAGFQKLFTSRIAPDETDRDILKWPLRIEILLTSPVAAADGIDINVDIAWAIDTIPATFISALLIDNGSLEVVNIGGADEAYELTIHMPQGSMFATRNLTLAASKSHVQALVLYDQWNMGALTVEPDSRNVSDVLSDVVGASVITWDPINSTYVVSSELLPGMGYWIKAIGNAVQLIPGDPIGQNIRGPG